jgi:hypothetical protein
MTQIPEDPAQLVHQRDLLVQAIVDAAAKAGIIEPNAYVNGPMALILCEDLATAALVSTQLEVAAYMVDGRTEQGLFFDKPSAENMAFTNAGTVVPLYRAPQQEG